MASPNIYTTGAGGTTGDELATVSPVYMSGAIWYVSSVTGSDAAGPRGKERVRPLATLAQAYTNASAGDVIVCLANHAETITSAQTLGKAGLHVIGEGSGSNRPRFTRGADAVLFSVTAAGVVLGNLYFPASTVATVNDRIAVSSTDLLMRNCYHECGALDGGIALALNASSDRARIESTTFASTAVSVSAQPAQAIAIGNAFSDLVLDTVIFDGGSAGWSDPYAFETLAAITRLYATNVDLLNDSDVLFATGTTGYFHVRNKSGSSRVVWTA